MSKMKLSYLGYLMVFLAFRAAAFRSTQRNVLGDRATTQPTWMKKANTDSGDFWRSLRKKVAAAVFIPALLVGSPALADDELARYAAEGNAVGVDGTCFFKKCALETSACGNDPSCLKGLSCLARCKGASMCSTGCFAKYGSERLDNLLHCSVEKNDCVHVPGKENSGWSSETLADLPAKPVRSFDMSSMKGTWYKVMGLDSRYDCFDCQKNSFEVKNRETLGMEALFRIPRPTFPGYLQSKIVEELHSADKTVSPLAQMQSRGEMFGLTFWENWYVLGDSKERFDPNPLGIASAFAGQETGIQDLKLIFYTGHTLQGSYKGAFLYSRTPELTPSLMRQGKDMIRAAGLDPNDFCKIRNQCFLRDSDGKKGGGKAAAAGDDLVAENDGVAGTMKTFEIARRGASALLEEPEMNQNTPFWYLGQNFFSATKAVGEELADWFEDPTILSDWLISQQEKMVLEQPLEVSPFAALADR